MAHLRKLLRHRVNHIANLLIVSKLSIDVYLYKRGSRFRKRNENTHALHGHEIKVLAHVYNNNLGGRAGFPLYLSSS